MRALCPFSLASADCCVAAEEAQSSVKGMEENAIHSKYIELVSTGPHPPWPVHAADVDHG